MRSHKSCKTIEVPHFNFFFFEKKKNSHSVSTHIVFPQHLLPLVTLPWSTSANSKSQGVEGEHSLWLATRNIHPFPVNPCSEIWSLIIIWLIFISIWSKTITFHWALRGLKQKKCKIFKIYGLAASFKWRTLEASKKEKCLSVHEQREAFN